MKKIISALAVAALVGMVAVAAQAAPFVNPDIAYEGGDYSAVNDPSKWFTQADGSVVTYWGDQWIEYKTYLTEGNWNIGLNVSNLGLLDDGWNFDFLIYNDWTGTALTIPGSSTEIYNGYFNVDVPSDGLYTVQYRWTNDRYEPPYDANIKIDSAFFDDTATVPEPGTLLLLGSGLLGLGLLRRSQRPH